MKHIIVATLLLLNITQLIAQEQTERLKLLVSSRVDTSKADVKAIIALYENYMNARPDSVYNNPYWNKAEKDLYKDFDFSRESLFQGNMNAQMLFRYYYPFVMSVEPIGAKYQIRVLYSSTTINPKFAGSKVWCIHKLNTIKEGGHWVFENLMVELSKNWMSQKVGFIEFIYPPNHNFSHKDALKSQLFCNEIINRFNPNYKQTFRYYVCSSIDDMGLLENFDYYFVGVTTGKAREGMVLSAKGNEFYPHEFVHKLLPENKNRGYLIEEGLATFLGTKQDPVEYIELMHKLSIDLANNAERINFKSVVSQKEKYSGYQTAYPAGAAICELVYNSNGDKGLRSLFLAETRNYTEIINTVSKITKLSEKEIEQEWLKIVAKYR